MSILEVRGVSKQFGGLKALNDVNLSVEEGSVRAVIGPNGAGKSTLLNCFVGRLIPDSGSVNFDGHSLIGQKPFCINQFGVARVFQTPEIFPDLTVLENVMLPAISKRDGAFKPSTMPRLEKMHDIINAAEEALLDVELADERKQMASVMSRGNKRRLELAMCLVQKPKLLLLDEPTAGMARADTNNTIDLLKRIGEQRKLTKVIIEHDMHVVFSLADSVTVMAQGAVLVEGKPDEIKGNPKVQEAYLGGAHL